MDRREAMSLFGLGAPLAVGAVLAARSGPGPGRGAGLRGLPNYALTTHEGREVRFYDDLVKGKLVLINFMYTNCKGICPGQTANLVKVQRHFGDRAGRDVHMYSITLQPEVDTPAELKKHAQAHRTGPGWTYLTGAPADVESLRRRLGFVDLDPAKDRLNGSHIGVLLYGNEPLDRWAACPAMAAPDLIAYNVLGLKGEAPPWMPPFRKSSGRA